MKNLVFGGTSFEIIEKQNVKNSFCYSDIEKVYIKFTKSNYDNLLKYLKLNGLLKYSFVVKFKNNQLVNIKIRPCERYVFLKHISLINKNCKISN